MKCDLTSAKIYENGDVREYEMLSMPFLYQDKTYLPVRDIAEAFGIEIAYQDDDRFVALRSESCMLFIPPDMTYIGGAYRYGEISSASDMVAYKDGKMVPSEKLWRDRRTYILIHNRSRAPLRDIVELFGFNVVYDDESRTITIEGERAKHSKGEPFFSDEQEKLIRAMRSYEAAKCMALYDILGIPEYFERGSGIQTRGTGYRSSGCKIMTLEGVVFASSSAALSWFPDMYSQYPIMVGSRGHAGKTLPTGEYEGILHDDFTSSNHPLVGIGETFFSGSNKYKEMEIAKLSETEKAETLIVTMIDGLEVAIEVEIDKISGKLCRYTEKMEAGRSKTWSVNY